jgi:ABC-type Na+ transport system ATPase subunit NatA
MTTPVLEVEGLTKRYGRRTVVDHLSFELPAGVVAGFIGPNGAGKTTTMAMVLGLVRPNDGRGTVLGEPLGHPERYLGRVGALVEGPALWPSLTAVENLRLLARLGATDEARIPAVLDAVGLADRARERFADYSLGMKQRLGIAAALLGDPALIVLDEPANGLDPIGMSEMRDLLRRLAAEGRTILVSSHILSELEQVSDAGEAHGFASPLSPAVSASRPPPLVVVSGGQVWPPVSREVGETGGRTPRRGDDARSCDRAWPAAVPLDRQRGPGSRRGGPDLASWSRDE